MPKAARVGDTHICPLHGTGIIQLPCSLNVKTNSRPQARVTDRLLCAGGVPDFIVTGSAKVKANSLPVARVGDKTMHGGTIGPIASLNVEVGGGTVGATLGFPDAWLTTFNAEAAGRTSGKVQQSYGNCGIESLRALVLANGGNVSENDALNWAIANAGVDDSTDPNQKGGSNPDGREKVLSNYGVASHQENASRENITQAVAEGKGVITSHDAGQLWNNPAVNGGHAITVTGVEYNADGTIGNVITNDTGLGQGRRSVPAKRFFDSLRPGRNANVSDNPLKK